MVHEVQDNSTPDDEWQCLLKAPTQPQQRKPASGDRDELTIIFPALDQALNKCINCIKYYVR